MFTLWIFPWLASIEPGIDWWFYNGLFFVVDLYCFAITWRVGVEIYYAIRGLDPNPSETERVNALNRAIGHDQDMLSFLGQNRSNWQDQMVQREWGELKATEGRLRVELEQAGGHESLD